SDMTRMDAAAALGAIAPGDIRLFTFSDRLVEVPPRRGMAGVDAIVRSQLHGGTHLGAALHKIYAMPHDRLIVVTDEQSHDRVPQPVAKRSYNDQCRFLPERRWLWPLDPHRRLLGGGHPLHRRGRERALKVTGGVRPAGFADVVDWLNAGAPLRRKEVDSPPPRPPSPPRTSIAAPPNGGTTRTPPT